MNDIILFMKAKSTDLDEKFIEELIPFIINRNKQQMNFDKAIKWISYSSKKNAKRILVKYFNENKDYIIEKPKKQKGRGGHNKEIIKITYKTFEQMAMMAKTDKGKQMREYMSLLNEVMLDFTTNNMYKKPKKQEQQILEYDNDKSVSKYYNKEIVYLLRFNTNCYKFGITNNLRKRLLTHANELKFEKIIKLWQTPDKSYAMNVENKIKKYIKIENIHFNYKKQKEIFQTDDIEKIIPTLNIYVKQEYKNYKNKQITFQQKMDLKLQIHNMKILKAIKSIQDKLDDSNDIIKILDKNNFQMNNEIKNELLIDENNEEEMKIENNQKNKENEDISNQLKKNVKNNKELIDDMIDDMHGKKLCKKCSKIKNLEYFISSKLKGYTKTCNICRERDKNKPSKNSEKKKQYNQEYREKNHEKLKKKNREYNEKNKKQKREYNEEYRKKNKKILKKKDKEKYEKNKEKILEQKKEYYQENREEIRVQQKQHYDITKKLNI